MHRTRPPVSRSGLIGGHTSLRSRSYTGCRSSTVSPSKLLQSCIRLSTVDARRTSLTLSCLLQPTRMYANLALPLLEPLPRQTKQDAVWKACLLSGRPRHMKQSPRHHPYHRLPPSFPSCAQDTSVPLSI